MPGGNANGHADSANGSVVSPTPTSAAIGTPSASGSSSTVFASAAKPCTSTQRRTRSGCFARYFGSEAASSAMIGIARDTSSMDALAKQGGKLMRYSMRCAASVQ